LFGLVQKRVTPVEHCAQSAVAVRRGSFALGQQGETVVETLLDLADGQQSDMRGRELDRQRQAVEPTAQGTDIAHRVLAGDKGGADHDRTGVEEFGGFRVGHRRQRVQRFAGGFQR